MALRDAVLHWFRLLEAGFASGQCQPVLDQVRRDLPSLNGRPEASGDDAYAALFSGAAYGCLGQLGPARTELEAARARLPRLENNDGFDASCNAQRLLVWAFQVYLGQRVPLDCGPTTTATSTVVPTSTTSP